MEPFFNLLWVAISLLLIGMWLVRTATRAGDPVRYSIGVQLVALALLIVILLPVVSLTDDLHASALLAEADHMWRRSDFQAIGHLALHTFALTIASAALLHSSQRSRIIAWLSFPAEQVSPLAGYLRIFGTRPPPAA